MAERWQWWAWAVRAAKRLFSHAWTHRSCTPSHAVWLASSSMERVSSLQQVILFFPREEQCGFHNWLSSWALEVRLAPESWASFFPRGRNASAWSKWLPNIPTGPCASCSPINIKVPSYVCSEQPNGSPRPCGWKPKLERGLWKVSLPVSKPLPSRLAMMLWAVTFCLLVYTCLWSVFFICSSLSSSL